MRKSILAAVALGATAVTLAACSSSGGGSGSSSTPPAGNSSSSSSSTTSGGTEVGVILPDTTSSDRYVQYDAPLLTKAFQDAGIKADVQNAQGDKTKFQTIATNMIGEGVKVLLIDSIDAPSGAAVESAAKAAGVQVIDYDRTNLSGGGSAAYYVSFDNEKVGELQGQGLLDGLSAAGKTSNAQVIEVDGGTDVDNNAVLFKQGARKILDPAQTAGKIKIVSDSVDKGWDVNQVNGIFTQALTANGGKVDGVLSANDGIAQAVIGVLKSNGLAGKVAITGQDASIPGLQSILQGNQYMTVFKDVSKEADAASKLAIALVKGQDPTSAGLTLTDFTVPGNSNGSKAVLLSPEVITKKNVEDVVTAGAVKVADLCNGIQSACDAAGVK
ncbi:MAG TPA: substrate-binding domain-containing protein [Jatrophihabitans sp.]